MKVNFGIGLLVILLAVSLPAVYADVVFYATFDDTLDATISGGSTTGSSSGSVTYGTGVKGGSLVIDGVGIWFGNYMPTGRVGSLEIWYNTSNTVDDRMFLVQCNAGDIGTKGIYTFVDGTAEQVRVTTNDGTNVDHWSPSESTWVNGEWHQMVYTWDTDYVGTMYLDGSMVQQLDNDANYSPNTFGTMYVGSRLGTKGDMSGFSLDELVIYDTELTASEVEARYNSVIPEPATLGLLTCGLVLGIARRRRKM